MSFPAYRDYVESEIGWLGRFPATWSRGRLRYLLELLVDGTHRSPESHLTGDYSYITAKNIKEHGFDFSELTYVTEDDHREIYSRCPVRKDDVLYIKDGATAGIAMVNTLDEEFSLLSSVALLRPLKSIMIPRFVAYHLNAGQFKTDVLNRLVGGAMTRFTLDMIGRFIFAIPPLLDQVAIVAFLDRETAKIDELVAEQRRLIELLKEKRQAVISHAVTKGLNPDSPLKPSGVEWLGDVPAHWEVIPLMHLTPSDRQIMYGIVLPGPHVDDGVPIVKGGDVSPSRLNPSTLNRTTHAIEAGYKRSRLQGGDIVYAIRGSIGEAAIVPESLTGANLTQDAARIAPLPRIDVTWLLYTLKSDGVFRQLEQTVNGATIRGINIFQLKRARLPVPPAPEQRRIAEFLEKRTSEFDNLVDDAELAINLLLERRTALISAAVTGKIDVRGLADAEAA